MLPQQLRVLDVDRLVVLRVQVRHELAVPWSLQHLRELLHLVLWSIVASQVFLHLDLPLAF